MDRRRSTHVQKGGVSQYLTYIGVSLSSFHQIRPHPLFLSSLSLSSMWWELSRSRSFGVIPGRSEHIPGHSVTFFNMFSRYFVKSLTLVLGFHHWKELGLGSLIYFLGHGFMKIRPVAMCPLCCVCHNSVRRRSRLQN